MATKVIDPALLAQLNGSSAPAGKPVTDPAILAQLNASDPGLALPGTSAPPQAGNPMSGLLNQAGQLAQLMTPTGAANAALGGIKSFLGAGNPMDALASTGEGTIESIPIAGPALHGLGEQARAFVGRTVYGDPTATPQSMEAADQARDANYPTALATGHVLGPVATYGLASQIPGVAPALGLSGPMAQRFLLGIPSQYATNVADEMAHGKPMQNALVDSIIPTAEAAPFFLFGPKGGKPQPPTPRQAAVATLDKEGIPLTAGQKTGSKFLQYRESELGGTKADTMMERQKEAFVAASLKRAGTNAQRATPEVLDQGLKTIGKHFDALANMTPVPLDQKLQNDMLNVVVNYKDSVGTPAPIVEKLMNRIGELAGNNGGVLKGRAYQNIRSELGAAGRSADGPAKIAIGDLQHALDDAVERHASGATKAAWQLTRQRWGNLADVTNAIGSAKPEDAGVGLFSPTNLATAMKGFNRRGYARGGGDLNELAHAGTAVMTPLPNTGTAQRVQAHLMMSTPTAIASALLGHDYAGIPGAIGGMAIGLGLPAVTGRAMLSGPGRAMLAGEGPVAGALQSMIPNIVSRSLIGQ